MEPRGIDLSNGPFAFLDEAVQAAIEVPLIGVVLAGLLAASVVAWPRDAGLRRRVRFFWALPLLWLVTGLTGLLPRSSPDWVEHVPAGLFLLQLAASMVWLVRAEGARGFVAAYGLLNLYFGFVAALTAVFSITGLKLF